MLLDLRELPEKTKNDDDVGGGDGDGDGDSDDADDDDDDKSIHKTNCVQKLIIPRRQPSTPNSNRVHAPHCDRADG